MDLDRIMQHYHEVLPDVFLREDKKVLARVEEDVWGFIRVTPHSRSHFISNVVIVDNEHEEAILEDKRVALHSLINPGTFEDSLEFDPKNVMRTNQFLDGLEHNLTPNPIINNALSRYYWPIIIVDPSGKLVSTQPIFRADESQTNHRYANNIYNYLAACLGNVCDEYVLSSLSTRALAFFRQLNFRFNPLKRQERRTHCENFQTFMETQISDLADSLNPLTDQLDSWAQHHKGEPTSLRSIAEMISGLTKMSDLLGGTEGMKKAAQNLRSRAPSFRNAHYTLRMDILAFLSYEPQSIIRQYAQDIKPES